MEPGHRTLVHVQGRLPRDLATGRLDHPGGGPRCRGAARRDGERVCAGRHARLVLRAAAPVDLALPVDRSSGSERGVRPRRGDTRPFRRDLQRPSPLRPLRPVLGARRRAAFRRARPRTVDTSAGDPAAARRAAGPGHERRAGVPHRRLQLPVASGLDPRGRCGSRPGPISGGLARLPGIGRCGLP